jgi:hypothetical protein
MPFAYIYLIMMADGVYKVGRTEQDFGLDLKRFKSYPRDSTVVFVRMCSEFDVIRYEAQILKKFREEFGKHPRGAEYFIKGPEGPMIRMINEIMDVEPQAEFFKGLEKGPELWVPYSFLQSRFEKFCRANKYALRPLDVKTVFERRGCLLECELVLGVS